MTQLVSPDLAQLDNLDIDVLWRSDGDYSASRISELSRTGAFIRTHGPAPVGTLLYLRLAVPGGEICAQAVVRRVRAHRGMGVEFESMADDERARLDILVRQAEVAGSVQRKRGVERRYRVRYKFAATVELTEPGSAQPVQAELVDLGRSGCYVRLVQPFPVGTVLEISATENGRSFHARATVASAETGRGMGLTFMDVDPKERVVLDGWLATSTERIWLAANRRRSQRILVNIPVHVAAKSSSGSEISERAKTIFVSAHGALLQLAMDVAKGQTIVLRNPSTNDALECSVDYLSSTRDGRREVGVSFVLPNRTFWQITFPPEDWSPQHPDAKRTS